MRCIFYECGDSEKMSAATFILIGLVLVIAGIAAFAVYELFFSGSHEGKSPPSVQESTPVQNQTDAPIKLWEVVKGTEILRSHGINPGD